MCHYISFSDACICVKTQIGIKYNKLGYSGGERFQLERV